MAGLVKSSRLIYGSHTYSVKVNYRVNVENVNDGYATDVYDYN
jgi:hypothetical protein